MEPLKTRGLKELIAFRHRLRRQRAMGRIARVDFEYIDRRVNEIEARVVSMTEHDRHDREVDGSGF